jgi:hypothetical protein
MSNQRVQISVGATEKKQDVGNEYLKEINQKIPSMNGFRYIDIVDEMEISGSTPQMTVDPKKRKGWYYTNTNGPVDVMSLTAFNNTTEPSGMDLFNLKNMWCVATVDLDGGLPYFQVTTTASVWTYKIDSNNAHIGIGERCMFYHGTIPTIGSEEARLIRFSEKVLVSGPGVLNEDITDIQLITDSAALANTIKLLVERLGFQTDKANQVIRNIELDGYQRPITTHVPFISSKVWDNVIPGISGKSSVLEVINQRSVSFFGAVDDACTISVEVSNDNFDWYKSAYSVITSKADDFHIPGFDVDARYVRLDMNLGAVTITAIASAK